MDGYVPNDLGIGGGDYVEFRLCLNCGQMQGNYPMAVSALEYQPPDQEVIDFYLNTIGPVLNKQDKYSAVKNAEYLSPKLAKFVSTFFEVNHFKPAPSPEKFLLMYKCGNCYLDY